MEFIENILVKEDTKNKFVEVESGGELPAVLFSDEGVTVAIVLTQMNLGSNVIKLTFGQGQLNLVGKIVLTESIAIYAGKSTFIDLNTGVVYTYMDIKNEDGSIPAGYLSEYNYYTNLFGESGSDTPIYSTIQQFIQDKLSNGLTGYERVKNQV